MRQQKVLVVDNGTYECKAGLHGSLQIATRNQVSRVKDKRGNMSYVMEGGKRRKDTGTAAATVKNMFDGPVVYNYDVYKGTLEAILAEVGEEKVDVLIITECFLNPRMFQAQALAAAFASFSFKAVQFGYDFIYAYEHNLQHNKKLSTGMAGIFSEAVPSTRNRPFCDVIVSMGHQGVHTVPVDPSSKKILYGLASFLPFGGLLAQNVFFETIAAKYYGSGTRVTREEVDEHFKSIRVAQEYLAEVREMINEGTHTIHVKSKVPPPKEKPAKAKGFPKRKAPATLPEKHSPANDSHTETTELTENTEITEIPESDLADEDNEGHEESNQDSTPPAEEEAIPLTEEEELKRARKEKLIRGATEHRNKQKILRSLQRIMVHIGVLEEKELLATNPEEFMNRRKERLNTLEKTLKKRSFIRNELKNKKSPHSLALLKQALISASATPHAMDDNKYILEVKEAQELDLPILEEIEQIDIFLKENDQDYVSKAENIFDRIRNGMGIGGVCINIELLRTPEIIFNPSIIGLEQPGLTESLSDIFQVYDVRNIFITGGFSRIAGLKERVEKEILPLRYLPNTPVVTTASDPVYDAFKGASTTSEYFAVYTREEYKKHQDAVIKEVEV
ncbi:actin-related protein 5 [Nematocida displodere]|uniref:Actin-related protein 5 n=1 Tax=Nematocida displodere TaxID=1805483 RepID=A0A177EJM8_9MICR|nr:actin-related protein 5 [Nematocida displodere]